MAMRKYAMKANTVAVGSGYHPVLTSGEYSVNAQDVIIPRVIEACGVKLSVNSAVAFINEYFKQAISYACETGYNVNLSEHFSMQWSVGGNYKLKTAQVPLSALSLRPRLSQVMREAISPSFILVNEEVGFEVCLTGVNSDVTRVEGVVKKGEGITLTGEYLDLGLDGYIEAKWVQAGEDKSLDLTDDVTHNTGLDIQLDWNVGLAGIPDGTEVAFVVHTRGGDAAGDMQEASITAIFSV